MILAVKMKKKNSSFYHLSDNSLTNSNAIWNDSFEENFRWDNEWTKLLFYDGQIGVAATGLNWFFFLDLAILK